MNAPISPTRSQICLVGFRRLDDRLQFRLVAGHGESRWRLPELSTDADDPLPTLRQIAQQAGLVIDERQIGLLEEVAPARRDQFQLMRAYLAPATDAAEADAPETTAAAPWRIRWCFAEEARVRIRRKPLRRLIDTAVRRIEAKSSESSE